MVISRGMWFVIIGAAVAFVAYSYWQRSQVTPRLPISGTTTPAPEAGGWKDSLARIAEKLAGALTNKTPAAAPTAPAASSGVTWV